MKRILLALALTFARVCVAHARRCLADGTPSDARLPVRQVGRPPSDSILNTSGERLTTVPECFGTRPFSDANLTPTVARR